MDMNKDDKKYSFVIPCYNSENTIEIVVKSIIKQMELMCKQNYEIFLINDASSDKTWERITALCADNVNIIGINFSQNFGQHSAIMAAYRELSGDIIIGLDDDGEHSPSDLPLLLSKYNEGYDFVCGKYPFSKKNSVFRNLGTFINNKMASSYIGKPKHASFSSYYIISRFVVDEIIRYKNAYPYIGGLILGVTKNLSSIELPKHERIIGSSNYSFKKLIALWVNGFTAFSVKPLRYSSFIGFVVSILGFIFGSFTIIRKLFNPNIAAGYSSILATLLFLGGLIMVLLGIIGEYVGRIYICLNNSPQYVIKDKINSTTK